MVRYLDLQHNMFNVNLRHGLYFSDLSILVGVVLYVKKSFGDAVVIIMTGNAHSFVKVPSTCQRAHITG